MLDRMSLLLRFQAIAEAGSVRKAAERLNITQPALTRSLRQLEQGYGMELLERHARGVRPTLFGNRLLSTISRVTREWELAELEMTTPGSAVDGVLRVAAGPLWSAVVLPVVTTRLQKLFPNLSMEIGFVSGDHAVSAMIEGRLDVTFGSPPYLSRGKSLLASHQFTSIRDRVIARADHPIQTCGSQDYARLHDYPWVAFCGDTIYETETLHVVIERTGTAPDIRVRSASLLSIIRLLQEGDYLCMLPDAFAAGIGGMPIQPVPIDMGYRAFRTGAHYRKSIANFEPLRTMIDLCTDYFDNTNKNAAEEAPHDHPDAS